MNCSGSKVSMRGHPQHLKVSQDKKRESSFRNRSVLESGCDVTSGRRNSVCTAKCAVVECVSYSLVYTSHCRSSCWVRTRAVMFYLRTGLRVVAHAILMQRFNTVMLQVRRINPATLQHFMHGLLVRAYMRRGVCETHTVVITALRDSSLKRLTLHGRTHSLQGRPSTLWLNRVQFNTFTTRPIMFWYRFISPADAKHLCFS